MTAEYTLAAVGSYLVQIGAGGSSLTRWAVADIKSLEVASAPEGKAKLVVSFADSTRLVSVYPAEFQAREMFEQLAAYACGPKILDELK